MQEYRPSTYSDLLWMRSLARGNLYLSGEINDSVAERVAMEIEEIQLNGLEKIHVIIGSPGGSVFAGLSIYNTLDKFKKNGGYVITETRGYAASMSAIILQAGNERIAHKNSRILIHEVRKFTMGYDTVSSAEEQAVEMRKVNKQLTNILAERSNNSVAKITSLTKKKDCWLSAEEAKDLNLIDKILD